MSNLEQLRKLKETLKGLEQGKKELAEEQASDFEATKLALQTQSVLEIERIGDEIRESNDRTLEAIKAFKLAQDFDATVVRPTDYHYEVALSRRQGHTTWNKFGYNTDLNVTTPEIVGAQGGSFVPFKLPSTLSIFSDSTNDDGAPAGTGANGVVIYGVDENRKSQTEVVTLNGTTPVVTTTSWLGINRVAVHLAGSLYKNEGNIRVTGGAGTTMAYMPAGEGTTQQLMFFTQTDHTALIDWVTLNGTRFGSGTEPTITFKGWVYSAVSNSNYEVFRHNLDTSSGTYGEVSPSQPLVIGEQSCFWIEALTTRASTSTAARFSLIEVRDPDAV